MKERKTYLKVILLLLVLTCVGASMAAQIKEAPSTAPDTPRFDFSIFFTGNTQGNIEPCG